MTITIIWINDMITETSAVTFRQNLGEMLNQVQYRHDSIVINKDGKPVAALVDAQAVCAHPPHAGRASTPFRQRLAEGFEGCAARGGAGGNRRRRRLRRQASRR